MSLREETATVDPPQSAGGGRAAAAPAGEVALPTVSVAPETWIHKDDTGRALAVILSGFAAIVFAVLTVIGLLAVSSDTPTATVLAIVGTFAALAVAFAWLAMRLLGAGVRIDRGEVRIRGLLRTRRIPIAEAERFEPGILRSLPGHDEVGVQCIRSDGCRLDIWGMAAGGAVGEAGMAEGRAALEPLCRELNDLLERVGRGSGGSPGPRDARGPQ